MKKLFALALSLIMLVGVLSAFPVFATVPAGETQKSYTNVVTMTTLYNGDQKVVANTVYSISSVDELFYFAELCNDGNMYFDNATVILTDNITMNEGWTAGATAPTGENAENWTPIKVFKGTFDGQNNIISGLYAAEGVDYKANGAAEKASGFFASIGGVDTTVKNLVIERSYFYSTNYAGSVAGIISGDFTNDGLTLSNITSSAIVSSAASAGGIVGGNAGTYNGTRGECVGAMFDKCTFNGEISAKVIAGGIVANSMRSLTAIDCVNDGSITLNAAANTRSVGGILGVFNQGYGNFKLDGCENNGDVTATGAYNSYVGGIIGYVQTCFKAELYDCVNYGNVSSTSTTAPCLGGVIGVYAGTANVLNLNNCVNDGDVYTESATTELKIGGIIGQLLSGVTVANCVNSGNLYVKNDLSKINMGGIVGYFKDIDVTVNNCVNSGSLYSQESATDDSSTYGGIIGYASHSNTSTGNKTVTVSDCVHSGSIDIKTTANQKSALGGVVGSLDRWYGSITLENCVVSGSVLAGSPAFVGGVLGSYNGELSQFYNCLFMGTMTTAHSTYSGAFIGASNILFDLDGDGYASRNFKDSYHLSTYAKTIGLTDAQPKCKLNLTIGTETVTAIGASTGTINKINNPFDDLGATCTSLTDLNAIQNLKVFDWANTTDNGWKIQKVGNKYLPLPTSVADLIATDMTEKDNGVDYDGVQISLDKTAVRFVAAVDQDADYDAVGFEILVIKNGAHATATLETDKVYESLIYTDMTKPEGEQSTVYTVDGKYLAALAFTGIDASETVTFAVKTYGKKGDAVSYDDTCIVSVQNGKVFTYYK